MKVVTPPMPQPPINVIERSGYVLEILLSTAYREIVDVADGPHIPYVRAG